MVVINLILLAVVLSAIIITTFYVNYTKKTDPIDIVTTSGQSAIILCLLCASIAVGLFCVLLGYGNSKQSSPNQITFFIITITQTILFALPIIISLALSVLSKIDANKKYSLSDDSMNASTFEKRLRHLSNLLGVRKAPKIFLSSLNSISPQIVPFGINKFALILPSNFQETVDRVARKSKENIADLLEDYVFLHEISHLRHADTYLLVWLAISQKALIWFLAIVTAVGAFLTIRYGEYLAQSNFILLKVMVFGWSLLILLAVVRKKLIIIREKFADERASNCTRLIDFSKINSQTIRIYNEEISPIELLRLWLSGGDQKAETETSSRFGALTEFISKHPTEIAYGVLMAMVGYFTPIFVSTIGYLGHDHHYATLRNSILNQTFLILMLFSFAIVNLLLSNIREKYATKTSLNDIVNITLRTIFLICMSYIFSIIGLCLLFFIAETVFGVSGLGSAYNLDRSIIVFIIMSAVIYAFLSGVGYLFYSHIRPAENITQKTRCLMFLCLVFSIFIIIFYYSWVPSGIFAPRDRTGYGLLIYLCLLVKYHMYYATAVTTGDKYFFSIFGIKYVINFEKPPIILRFIIFVLMCLFLFCIVYLLPLLIISAALDGFSDFIGMIGFPQTIIHIILGPYFVFLAVSIFRHDIKNQSQNMFIVRFTSVAFAGILGLKLSEKYHDKVKKYMDSLEGLKSGYYSVPLKWKRLAPDVLATVGSLYSSEAILRMLGDNFDIEKHADFLLQCENPDGGFGVIKNSESDLSATSYAVEILNKYGKLRLVDKDKHTKWVLSCRQKNGHFHEYLPEPKSLKKDRCAINALYFLDSISTIDVQHQMRKAIELWKSSKRDIINTYNMVIVAKRLGCISQVIAILKTSGWFEQARINMANIDINKNQRIYFFYFETLRELNHHDDRAEKTVISYLQENGIVASAQNISGYYPSK